MKTAALALISAAAFVAAVLAGVWPGRGVPVIAVDAVRMYRPPSERAEAPAPAARRASMSVDPDVVSPVAREVGQGRLDDFAGVNASGPRATLSPGGGRDTGRVRHGEDGRVRHGGGEDGRARHGGGHGLRGDDGGPRDGESGGGQRRGRGSGQHGDQRGGPGNGRDNGITRRDAGRGGRQGDVGWGASRAEHGRGR